ncbi:MAG: TetR/AcrR family transcriptional regulator [Proteobacteria bacterium]|nr:TetR/AcrR family transcriptional regulator [Pseudomonadota bacterium]
MPISGLKRTSPQGAATRAKLLAAAETILLELGWDGVTAQAIQKRAGISQGSWAHAFPSGKAQVGAAIYTALHRDFWPAVLEPFKEHPRKNGQPTIRTCLDKLFAYAQQHRRRLRLLVSLEQILFGSNWSEDLESLQDEVDGILQPWADATFGHLPAAAKLGQGVLADVILKPALSIAARRGEPDGGVIAEPVIEALAAAAWVGVSALYRGAPPVSAKGANKTPPKSQPTGQLSLIDRPVLVSPKE